MKKGLCFCLLAICSLAGMLRARSSPLPVASALKCPSIPVSFSLINKPVVLYLPSSCSGLVNDAVMGEGTMNVSVQGRIQNSQLSLQVKVDYKGSAITTVGGVTYQVNDNVSASDLRDLSSGPVNIFIKGLFKLVGKDKSALYLGDVGYITVFPDGSVSNHIFDPHNDPEYSRPKVYCSNPPGS